MSWYKNYKLIENDNEYVVEIYLNPNDTEFSEEFFTNIKENVLRLDDNIKNLIQKRLPTVKVATVKLIVGTMVVATIPFMPISNNTVKAADLTSTTTQSTTTQVSSITLLNTTGVVVADALNVRSGPNTTNSIIYKLYRGNTVQVIGQVTGWYQIKLTDGRIGWVSSSYLSLNQPTRQQKVDLAISIAKSLLGTPYVWGGESLAEGGFDCSGFTQYVFKQVNYTLNRVSFEQATQGVYVDRASIQPGDLVFYSLAGDGRISHVGIYIGDGKMIHSPKTGDVVKITDITTSYWQSHYITARRIIQ